MKAVTIIGYGGTEVLEIKDVPPPTPKQGQVLVTVHTAGLNPFDKKLAAGVYKTMIPLQFPVTLGGDFAGVVTKTGEEVYGSALVLNGGSGSYAQIAAANTGNIAPKPKRISFEEAAGLPVAGVSAVDALEEYIKLKKGQKILIHGGAGGIGHMAIQLAKATGAYVATTIQGDSRAFVTSLGADEIIDYKTQKFEEVCKDFDSVFDTVGGETTNKSFGVLKRGGVLVSMLGKPSQEYARRYGVTAIGQNTKTDTPHLTHLTELVESGKIKVHVDRVFGLGEVKEAFSYQQTGHPRGKVVLKIR